MQKNLRFYPGGNGRTDRGRGQIELFRKPQQDFTHVLRVMTTIQNIGLRIDRDAMGKVTVRVR